MKKLTKSAMCNFDFQTIYDIISHETFVITFIPMQFYASYSFVYVMVWFQNAVFFIEDSYDELNKDEL